MLDIDFYGKYRRYLRSVPDDFCLEFRANSGIETDKRRGILTVRPEVPAYDVMLVYCTFPYSQDRMCWDVRSVKEAEDGTSLLLKPSWDSKGWTNYNPDITLKIPEDARILQHTRYAHVAPRVVYLYVGGQAPPMDEKVLEKDRAENRLTLLTPTIVEKIHLPKTQVGVASELSIDGNGTTVPTAYIKWISELRGLFGDDRLQFTGTVTVDKKTGLILNRRPPKYSLKTLQETLRSNQGYQERVEKIKNQSHGAHETVFKANRFDLSPHATLVTLLKNGDPLRAGHMVADVDFLHPLESEYYIRSYGSVWNDYESLHFTIPFDYRSLDESEVVRMIIQRKIKERS